MATFKPTSQVLRTPRSHTHTAFGNVTFPLVLVCRLHELGHARNILHYTTTNVCYFPEYILEMFKEDEDLRKIKNWAE